MFDEVIDSIQFLRNTHFILFFNRVAASSNGQFGTNNDKYFLVVISISFSFKTNLTDQDLRCRMHGAMQVKSLDSTGSR